MELFEGSVRFHHLMPGVWAMDARGCSHQWAIYHDSYDFCLIDAPPSRSDWKYNGRTYSVDPGHVMMAMQPGELHVNLDRTPPGNFLVVQVAAPLMKSVAGHLGWKGRGLNLKHPHPASTSVPMRAALEGFRAAVCSDLYGPGSRCTCLTRPGVHAENLIALVAAFVAHCAEDKRDVTLSRRAPALVKRAIEYLAANYSAPYELETLAEAVGAPQPTYLLQVFKDELGMPPSEYRRRILVAKTCETLATFPTKSLEMIAAEAGWAGRSEGARRANTVITHFRRTLGLTPNRFRSALRRHSAAEWRLNANHVLRERLRCR